MKKILLATMSGLFVSIIPMVGAFIYYNGPEWTRANEGFHLTISCIFVMLTIATGTFCCIMESE